MAMSRKKQADSSIYYFLKHNQHGSRATQHARKMTLQLAVKTLHAKGYKITDIRHLKQKHVACLLAVWREGNLSDGTSKNRMAHLRFVCNIMQRSGVIPSNAELGIPNRVYVTNEDKSLKCQNGDMSKIADYRIQVQLNLQRVFGLRHEECMKIKPYIADRGDTLSLEGSWCKGGRLRNIPIRTDEQRHWLSEAKKLAEQQPNSLIPQNLSYIAYSRYFYRVIKQAGFDGSHGLRHLYAQERYIELTGWACPTKGGKTSHELTGLEKRLDRNARMIISAELGHSREQITSVYLGR